MGVLFGAGVALVGAGATMYAADKASSAQEKAAGAAGRGAGAVGNLARVDTAGARSLANPAAYTLGNLLGLSPQKLNANDAYLARYGDVASAGVNPLEHMLQYGTGEGRTWGDETDAEYKARTGQDYGLGAGSPGYGSLMQKFTGDSVATDPGYQFGQQQGELGVNRAAARGGMALSPATIKALDRFNVDYSSTKFNEAFNRDQVQKNQQYNMLTGAQTGAQTATAQSNALGGQMANVQGQATMDAGNARAAGIMGTANAFNNGIGSIYNNYQQSQTANQFMNGYGYNPQTGFANNNANNSQYLP